MPEERTWFVCREKLSVTQAWYDVQGSTQPALLAHKHDHEHIYVPCLWNAKLLELWNY